MLDEMRRAATMKAYQLAVELEVERAKEQTAIKDAVRNHLDPGNNYWQHRHKAEQRLLATCTLLQILEGA